MIWLDNHLSPALARWIAAEFGEPCVQIRDLDLARAYTTSDASAKESIESAVKATIAQFGHAARDVATTFAVA